MGPPRRSTALRAAIVALCAGLTVVLVLAGPSSSSAVRDLELVSAILLAVAALSIVIAVLSTRLGGWRDPASEEEFEVLVQRTEELAREGLWAEPDEGEFMDLDPLNDDDFTELVRDALDELPDLLQNALEHTAVVIRSGGRRRRAYGLYQGGGGSPGRIVIFRDTLRRDFGRDPEALREQVTRTLRHELAHHVGFDELGVRGLGL